MFSADNIKKRILCNKFCGGWRAVILRGHQRGCPFNEDEQRELRLRKLVEEIEERRTDGQ